MALRVSWLARIGSKGTAYNESRITDMTYVQDSSLTVTFPILDYLLCVMLCTLCAVKFIYISTRYTMWYTRLDYML